MNNNFGERLKKERVKLGKGSAEFAELCGVGKNSQTNYEKNEQKPNISYLAKATELGCDLQYIVMGTRSGDVPNAKATLVDQTEFIENIDILFSDYIIQSMMQLKQIIQKKF